MLPPFFLLAVSHDEGSDNRLALSLALIVTVNRIEVHMYMSIS
jgi:hypothetical protein